MSPVISNSSIKNSNNSNSTTPLKSNLASSINNSTNDVKSLSSNYNLTMMALISQKIIFGQ